MALKPLDRIPLSLSLRTQLVLVTSMLIALAIAVTSLVAISALRAQMVHQLDEEMKTSAPALVQLATVRPSGWRFAGRSEEHTSELQSQR